MAKTDKLIKARCLTRFSYHSKAYAVDDIFVGEQADIDRLAQDGSIDPHPDAVAYAENLKAS